MMEKPKYKDIHQRLLKFSEFVSYTGLPIRREDFFGNRFIDLIKFIFYLEKCLVRSIIVTLPSCRHSPVSSCLLPPLPSSLTSPRKNG
jgi:hypothetical protein